MVDPEVQSDLWDDGGGTDRGTGSGGRGVRGCSLWCLYFLEVQGTEDGRGDSLDPGLGSVSSDVRLGHPTPPLGTPRRVALLLPRSSSSGVQTTFYSSGVRDFLSGPPSLESRVHPLSPDLFLSLNSGSRGYS